MHSTKKRVTGIENDCKKVTTARSKVKSRSHHDDAHLHLITNVPTKYQLATPYRFQDIAWTRFLRSRSLQRGQRSNQGNTMMLHTYNPTSVSVLSIHFLHLTVSEISPGQDFIGQGHYGKVKGQINVTPSRGTATPPNQCPYHVPTSYTLPFPRYSPDKILQIEVTKAWSKVKSRSHHDVTHLHSLTNVPTKYQLPTPYGFRDIARTRFCRSRSLQQGQIKVKP